MKGVAFDVSLNATEFHNQDDNIESASKEVVAKEVAELENLQRRLSVRDLASQFESGQAAAKAAAAKLREEEKPSSPAKDVKRRLSGGHQCNHEHSHGHGHAHSPPNASRSPGESSPAFRSSLRRTSGNIRECERHKVKELAVPDRPALTKKLRQLLSELAGRVAGRNKDDVTEALSLVEMMEVHWTQKEDELEKERADVKKLEALFKQAADDAKRMAEEARSNAVAEVEAARGTVLRVEAALEEQAQSLRIAEKDELEELRKEVNEARRIKMLHERSKTMDMEFEIEGLRQQLTQKAVEIMHLRKEVISEFLGERVLSLFPELVVAAKRAGQSGNYEVQGEERLGAALVIAQINEKALELSQCNIQWHRMATDGSGGGPITGATRTQYAPEPLDVGWVLRADLTMPNGITESVLTTGAVDAAPGLGNYVEALFKKGGAEFNARLVQQNGEILEKPLLHVLLIDRTRIKLYRGRSTKAKEEYTSVYQLCGARGGGQAASRALYWVANRNLSLMLVLESERERNAAILLARRFARDQNVTLLGPDDGFSSSHS